MDETLKLSESKINIRKLLDLNKLTLVNHNVANPSSNVEIFFRDIKHELIFRINEADAIIGAVAWITDQEILSSLASRPTLLVIQKEDFLRPDMSSRLSEKEKKRLHDQYNSFSPFDGSKLSFGPLSQEDESKVKKLKPILCFGYYKEGESFRLPKMHNKFIVFLRELDGEYIPYAVWSGSYNFTQQSTYSLENAIFIQDEQISQAYASEAQMIYLMGDDLDWSSEWINLNNKVKNS